MKRMVFSENLPQAQFANWLDEVQDLATKIEHFANGRHPLLTEEEKKERQEKLRGCARQLWYRIHDITVVKPVDGN